MRIVFARDHEAIRRAWVERGEVLPPTVEVDVPDARLTPEIRQACTGDEVILFSSYQRNGRLEFKIPLRSPQSDYYYHDIVETAPVVTEAPTPEEAVALLDDWVRRSADAERRLAEAQTAERARKDAELRERRERDRQERERAEAARAAYAREREEWIKAHGSQRLKRLLAEGIGLDETYRAERLAQERPGFLWDSEVCGDFVGIRDAGEEALAALDEARQVAPDAKLAWRRVENPRMHVCEMDEVEETPTCNAIPGAAVVAEFLGERIVRVL